MFVTTSLLKNACHTYQRSMSLGMVYPPLGSSWIGTLPYRLFLFHVSVTVHPPHSDRHWPERYCFFQMTILMHFYCETNNLKISVVTATNICFQNPRSVGQQWFSCSRLNLAGPGRTPGSIPPGFWSHDCLEYTFLMENHGSTEKQAETDFFRPQLGAVTLSFFLQSID